MSIKVIDMAWIADRSLDIYCAKYTNDDIDGLKGKSVHVFPSVCKIFQEVFDNIIIQCKPRFDKTYFIVPCFPLLRMKKSSITTRFSCLNSSYLQNIGVSAAHFLEFFERFIAERCQNEYVSKVDENCFILNARGALLHDWKDAVNSCYGSSLVDSSKPSIFEFNPGFINTMEDDMSLFTETNEGLKFKLRSAIENLT